MWIPSKLSRPSYAIDMIQRHKIEACLQRTDKQKLILLRAPAGYGKTTFTSQWLASKQAVGWYNIDANDNDPYRFSCYFVAALNHATHHACKAIVKRIEQAKALDAMEILTEALKQIGQSNKPAYLVLDDYHHVHHHQVHQALSYFIKLMPDNLTLIITSRSAPPIGIASLRVHGWVTEIDQTLLAFDISETEVFLQQRTSEPLSDNEVMKLHDYVEGWPSALELMAWQTHAHPLSKLTPNQDQINQTHLWEYLIDEVFANVDSETQDFLLQCSVLNKFNHTLAAAVTERSDAHSVISDLQRFGLFIQPIANQPNWFRFHHLFQQFLAHERAKRLTIKQASLHNMAAQAWLTQANPQQALWHATQADEPKVTIDIIERCGWELFHRGDSDSLQNALNDLQATQIYQNANLCLLHAWLAQSQQRHEDVELILMQADSKTLATTSSQKAEFNALKAKIAISNNQLETALELAELALSQLDGQAFHSRIAATSVIGEVNYLLGWLDRALPLLQQTEKLARQYQVHTQALWAILAQSKVLFAKGQLQAAFDVQESGIKLIHDQQLDQSSHYGEVLQARAELLFSWNRLDEAEQCANQALALLSDQAANTLALASYALLAVIALCKGSIDKAAKHIAQIELRLNHPFVLADNHPDADLARLLYWQVKQDSLAIQLWLEKAPPLRDASNQRNQLHGRNIARAQLALGDSQQAQITIEQLQNAANAHHLLAENSRNAVMEVCISLASSNESESQTKLREAFVLANQTSILGDFLYNFAELKPLLQHSGFQAEIDELTRYRVNMLLKSVKEGQRSANIHFDQHFIDQIVHHPNVPELVRSSPLTQREWQVLGLIYSGLTNEQIAHQLDVAGTTIKTHIRNLYQKLDITNRKQAMQVAEKLIRLTSNE